MINRKRAVVAMADDEARRSVTLILRNRGFQVISATNLEDAGMFVENQPPDYVITDPALDNGHGLDLVRKAKRVARKPMVVVVANRKATQIRRRAISAGADALVGEGIELVRVQSA